jgi:hypothetical protein
LGYSDRELALTSEGIMFSLVPDKAPPDHRAKLVGAQMLRENEARDQRERDKEAATAQTQVRNLETQYTAFLRDEVSRLQPGAYPASQAWFGSDHDSYSRELLAVAQQIAAEATKAGVSVSLDTANVAPHLEKRLAERAARWVGFQAPGTQVPATTLPPAAPAQPTTPVVSPPVTRPTPSGQRKLTEKEIIERATAAAFGRI